MKPSTQPSNLLYGLAALFSLITAGSAATVTWVAQSEASNSNATFPTGSAYTNNFGIAFKTGSSGTFSMDWLRLGLNSSSSSATSATVKVELRDTTNSTDYSGVAGTTAHTTDTVTLTLPGVAATNFNANLTEADAPNLMAYTLQPNTAYSLIFYAPSVNFGVQRRTGYANGTTNNFYTVSEGFTVFDTFRNNTANYTNTSGSYPTLNLAFGANAPAAVPEPAGAGAVLLLGSAGMALVRRRRR